MQHIIHFVHVLLVCALRYIFLSLLHGFSDVSHMVYLHIAYIFINIFLCSLKMRIDYICQLQMMMKKINAFVCFPSARSIGSPLTSVQLLMNVLGELLVSVQTTHHPLIHLAVLAVVCQQTFNILVYMYLYCPFGINLFFVAYLLKVRQNNHCNKLANKLCCQTDAQYCCYMHHTNCYLVSLVKFYLSLKILF